MDSQKPPRGRQPRPASRIGDDKGSSTKATSLKGGRTQAATPIDSEKDKKQENAAIHDRDTAKRRRSDSDLSDTDDEAERSAAKRAAVIEKTMGGEDSDSDESKESSDASTDDDEPSESTSAVEASKDIPTAASPSAIDAERPSSSTSTNAKGSRPGTFTRPGTVIKEKTRQLPERTKPSAIRSLPSSSEEDSDDDGDSGEEGDAQLILEPRMTGEVKVDVRVGVQEESDDRHVSGDDAPNVAHDTKTGNASKS